MLYYYLSRCNLILCLFKGVWFSLPEMESANTARGDDADIDDLQNLDSQATISKHAFAFTSTFCLFR